MRNLLIVVIVFTLINLNTKEIVAQNLTQINKLKYQHFRIKADYKEGFINLIGLAKATIENSKRKRIEKQIQPDGSMP